MQHCIKDEQLEELIQIMENVFAAIEWKQFMDTHPWDQDARASFLYFQNAARTLEQAFMAKYPWMSDEICGIYPWELDYECQ